MGVEIGLVKKYMSMFQIYDQYTTPYFGGWVTNIGWRNNYYLKLELSSDFPFRKPSLFVVVPQTLWMIGGIETVNSRGVSHSFHTLTNGPNGCVQICHVRDWDASMTCQKVLLMGVLWCGAYEEYFRTGRDIKDILSDYLYRKGVCYVHH